MNYLREFYMKKIENIEKLNELREDLNNEYDSKLPDYLEKYLTQEELRIKNSEFFKARRIEFLNSYHENTPEERKEYAKERADQFWKNDKLRLVKKRKRTGNPIFNESKRNIERVEQERELTNEERAALISICEKDIYLFAIRYFSHYLKKPSSPLHRYLYGFLNRSLNKKKRKRGFKHAIAAPRGYAKSTLISAILPLWCIAYNKKRFIILISDTAGQAEDFLTDIKRELEFNALLKRDFPYLATKGSVWRSNEIITKNNVKVLALGTGSKIRGRRFGIDRPGLIICHERGTKVLYNNSWINVEDHPSVKSTYVSNGYELYIHGLPYSETVSTDHRYYAKRILKKKAKTDVTKIDGPSWIHADDIDNRTYIGYKIDTEVIPPQPVKVYKPDIKLRSNKGQIIKCKASFVDTVPKEFSDTDFWWLLGLWMGDGYSSGKYAMNISIANNDVYVFDRLKKVLNRYNKKFSIQYKEGCIQVIFSWSWLARWTYSWRYGNSKKVPPYWIEKIDTKYQKEFVKGYIDADGYVNEKLNEVRITSVCYDGLLSIRRILMRLGIPSSIRKGIGPGNCIINGRLCHASQKYDLRFRENASILGLNIKNQCRYSYTRVHIENGYLWSKVKSISGVSNREFVPIKTDNSKYTTHFGVSHNCDDLESSDMIRSPSTRDFVRYEWFNKDLLYVGGEEGSPCDILVVGTILGKDSLLNALLNPEEYPDWTSRRFKAVNKFSTSTLWDKWGNIYKDKFNPNRIEDAKDFFLENKDEMLDGTDVLWPEGESYYDLMIYKLSNPSGFTSEKQNDPIDANKILVSVDQLRFESFSSNKEIQHILNSPMSRWYGFIDPSLGKYANKGDFSCIPTICQDKKSGLLLVVNFDMKRRKVDNQIEAILRNHLKYNYDMFGVETNAFQLVIADNLRKKARRENIYIPIKEVIQKKDKKMRIEGIIPLILDGTLVFDSYQYKYSVQYNDAVEQIVTYTGENDRHDDAPDSLASCVDLAKKKRFRLITKQTR